MIHVIFFGGIFDFGFEFSLKKRVVMHFLPRYLLGEGRGKRRRDTFISASDSKQRDQIESDQIKIKSSFSCLCFLLHMGNVSKDTNLVKYIQNQNPPKTQHKRSVRYSQQLQLQ